MLLLQVSVVTRLPAGRSRNRGSLPGKSNWFLYCLKLKISCGTKSASHRIGNLAPFHVSLWSGA